MRLHGPCARAFCASWLRYIDVTDLLDSFLPEALRRLGSMVLTVL